MATIDIRATTTCSLGTLISGSLSDDYLQGSGLVKTRGQCELVGLHTPAVGTLVTFSYTSNGVTKTIPRVVRVLSSFADPYRKITKVELGCKLTYFDNVTPAPTVDGIAPVTSGLQQQCLNGYTEYAANTTVPVPVKASGVMNTCLTKLGLTASSNPLTNVFNVSTFDLSPGYVSILNDLLLSESYFGYLDANETLQIRSLNAEGGTGPVITGSQIIDLDAIGVGDLPGEAVIVRYDSLKLKTSFDTTNTIANSQSNWEYEETIGDPQTVDVRYTSNGAVYTQSFSFVPHTTTTTTYGPDLSWNSLSCVIFSFRGEGADLSNSVIKRVTTQRTLVAESANSYCAQVFGIGGTPGANITADITTEEEYEYNEAGEVIKRTTSTYEPFFKWAGGLGVDFVYTTTYVTLSSLPVLVERVVEEYVNIYAPQPKGVRLNPGEQYEPVVDGQKITTTTYRNWALTIGGQQGSAAIKDTAPFTTASECSAWLNYANKVMVMVDSQVRTNRGRLLLAGQLRSSQSSRIGQSNGSSGETTAQLAYVMGSASSERFITFSMPYQSDDTFTSTGTIKKGDAEAKALNFGRIQNRLLLGNRNGVNLQLHPNSLPAAPFDPLYLSDGSLMVQYRANGMNWAFSTEGVVAGVDALFWGVAGGTGTAWVPVAPGITSFPPLPTITPPASGSTVSTTSVSYLTPAWNEQVALTGTTSTTATIASYPYAVGLLDTTAITVSSITTLRFLTELFPDTADYTLSGRDASLLFRYKVRGDATSFALTGPTETTFSRISIVVSANATMALTGQAANLKYARRMPAELGTFSRTHQDATLRKAKYVTAALGTFAMGGQAAGKIRTYIVVADPRTALVTGQDAVVKYDRPFAAELGNFALTGSEATFITPPKLYAAPDNYTLSGADANLATSLLLSASAADYAVSGNPANTTYNLPQVALLSYTGNGSSAGNTITGVGFKPGFIWTKRTGGLAENHNLFPSLINPYPTTTHYAVKTNTGNIDSAAQWVTYDTNGFTLKNGSIGNNSAAPYWAMCFKEGTAESTNNDGSIATTVSTNAELGFSQFRFVGTGANATIGHGLGAAPELIIVQNLAITYGMAVGGTAIGGANRYLSFRNTGVNGMTTEGGSLNTQAFTGFSSTTVSLGPAGDVNYNGAKHHGFAFRSVAGVTKVGSFTGTGAASQAITGFGFTPGFVLVKSYTGAASNWVMFSSGRNGRFYANTSDIELANSFITFDADGFTLASGASVNTSGSNYVYLAFAQQQSTGTFITARMPAETTGFAVSAQDAGKLRKYALSAEPLTLATTGQAAALNYVLPVTYLYNVSVTDAYANVNSAGKWFVNGSAPSFYKVDANNVNAQSFLSSLTTGLTVAVSTNGTTFTNRTITAAPVDIFSNGNVWRLSLSDGAGLTAGASVWLKLP